VRCTATSAFTHVKVVFQASNVLPEILAAWGINSEQISSHLFNILWDVLRTIARSMLVLDFKDAASIEQCDSKNAEIRGRNEE
jgi:hypothetical protein